MEELALRALRQLLLFAALLAPVEVLFPARPEQGPLRRGLWTDLGWAARQLMRLNGAVDAFGPTRFFRSMIIVDKKKLADSLYQVWSWDFERVVVSHGRVLESPGQ